MSGAVANGAHDAVLVVGPSWVGDMVMAQSLFIALHEQGLAAHVDVLAPSWSLPLIARMPQVRDAIEMPLGHGQFGLGARRALGRQLRTRGYRRAIVLPRSMKAALVPFFAGIPVRSGYRGEMRFGLINDMRPLDKSVLKMTVQRFVALGLPPGSPAPPPIPVPQLRVDADRQKRLLADLNLGDPAGAVALLPGAEYGPSKCWPLEYYAALAARLAEAGRPVWVLGSEKDSAAGERIAQAAPGQVHNLCGRTRLVDAVDLLALADQAVTNDSGLMHVAGAVGTPLVAVYGSTTPEFTPPLGEHATVLYRRLECSPCFERECPLQHLDCLRGIGVDEVYAALSGLAPRKML